MRVSRGSLLSPSRTSQLRKHSNLSTSPMRLYGRAPVWKLFPTAAVVALSAAVFVFIVAPFFRIVSLRHSLCQIREHRRWCLLVSSWSRGGLRRLVRPLID
ncbi:hypothetical protein PIB30_017432 [Stylosanthes scabra]|uniref:Uncharacterized protein n=1 Tax=Stylosanthes scabra TaxID=79078 RepID=A0ABU6X7I9_9FABA|nr:hypothetical protein [Stylosanthes scabra]